MSLEWKWEKKNVLCLSGSINNNESQKSTEQDFFWKVEWFFEFFFFKQLFHLCKIYMWVLLQTVVVVFSCGLAFHPHLKHHCSCVQKLPGEDFLLDCLPAHRKLRFRLLMGSFVCGVRRPLLTLCVSWIQSESNLPLLEESEVYIGIFNHFILRTFKY